MINNHYPKSIVFDLDGTLIDSVPVISVALNETLKQLGIGDLSLEEVKKYVGFGAKWMIKEVCLVNNHNISDEKLLEMMSLYVDSYMANSAKHTKVYDGVYNSLELLKLAGVKMGICTNKPGQTTTPVLTSLKLDQFFDAIITEDDTKFRKPDARHVLETLNAISGKPSHSVFVGDSETDMLAAQSAKVISVCVTYGYCHVPYTSLNADALLDEFNQLPRLLSKFVFSD